MILLIHKFDKAYFRKTTNKCVAGNINITRPSGDEKGINFIIYL